VQRGGETEHPQREIPITARVNRAAAPHCTGPTTGEGKKLKKKNQQGYRKEERNGNCIQCLL